MRRILPGGPLALVLWACMLPSACLLLPNGRARELYVVPEFAGRVGRSAWHLEEVATQQELPFPTVEEDALYILRLALARRNLEADPGADPLFLKVRIKERELEEDLRTRRTATVEIEAYTAMTAADASRLVGDMPAAMLLYSETTAESIRSYAYLNGLLERALRLLAQ